MSSRSKIIHRNIKRKQNRARIVHRNIKRKQNRARKMIAYYRKRQNSIGYWDLPIKEIKIEYKESNNKFKKLWEKFITLMLP